MLNDAKTPRFINVTRHSHSPHSSPSSIGYLSLKSALNIMTKDPWVDLNGGTERVGPEGEVVLVYKCKRRLDVIVIYPLGIYIAGGFGRKLWHYRTWPTIAQEIGNPFPLCLGPNEKWNWAIGVMVIPAEVGKIRIWLNAKWWMNTISKRGEFKL